MVVCFLSGGCGKERDPQPEGKSRSKVGIGNRALVGKKPKSLVFNNDVVCFVK